MGYCDNLSPVLFESYYGVTYSNLFYFKINYNECLEYGNWKVFKTNFDNIYTAMNTLYVLSSLENWPGIMYITLDSDYKEYVNLWRSYF
jgi:hypothetical protein